MPTQHTDISIYRNGYTKGITLALERYVTGGAIVNYTATIHQIVFHILTEIIMW